MTELPKEVYRTVVGMPSDSFEVPGPRQRVVGVLSGVRGIMVERTFRIEAGELMIGREPHLVAHIPDDNVSRHHARVMRQGNEFLLEDLSSSNGTFVDGVPVLSCVLRDGDAVQIGRNLFLFDRIYELVD